MKASLPMSSHSGELGSHAKIDADVSPQIFGHRRSSAFGRLL